MYRIDEHYTEDLFDAWGHIGPKRRKLLEKGWAGVFRKYLFHELPLKEIKSRFHETMGRPTKELYAMCGVLVLQQLFNYTDDETVEAFAFHIDWHYALDIRDESDRSMYVCNRTLREYSQIAVDLKIDEILFGSLTDRLLKAFQVQTGKQRLDSTHLLSNMKRLSRLDLFVKTITKFLKELKRFRPDDFENVVKEELRDRYLSKKNGYFSHVDAETSRKTLQEAAEDLLTLVCTFKEHKNVSTWKSYGLLKRLLEEQCEVKEGGGEEKVILKEAKNLSGSSMQNPSDPDASYDGHKGQGYQAQIMETYLEKPDEDDGEKKKFRPNMITAVRVETACEKDEDAPDGMIKETKERGCAPEELLADASYGSDENVGKAEKEGTELIAPTKGKPKQKKEMLVLDDFEFNEEDEITSCPAGEKPVQIKVTDKGNYQVKFDAGQCQRCEHRDYCQVGRGKTNYRLNYSRKQCRLAQRRAAEEMSEFRDKYRWRSGIEATNAKLKRVLGMGRLRVRCMGRVRFAVMLKALGWNILQAVRAEKDRISGLLTMSGAWMAKKTNLSLRFSVWMQRQAA